MDVQEAYSIILDNPAHDYGNFYANCQPDSPVGVGQLFSRVRFPAFDPEHLVYDTVESLVYLLTHECDIAQENTRAFNDYALVCPLIRLEDCLAQLNRTYDDSYIMGFLGELGHDRVSRVTYFPPLNNDYMPSGGIIYLNQISHTNLTVLLGKDAERITCLTQNGLRIVDYKLTNHLLRPKSGNVPLSRW